MEMKPILFILATALWTTIPGSGIADGASTTDPAPAIAAFEQACLADAPQFGDWKAIFHAAKIASLNRNSYGMPHSFPAGDAITDRAVVARNIGAPIVADCAVVMKGDSSAIASKSIKAFLMSPGFPLKRRSDTSYTAQTNAEKVIYQKAFWSNGKNFHVLVMTKKTPEFGMLTTLNASIVDDMNNVVNSRGWAVSPAIDKTWWADYPPYAKGARMAVFVNYTTRVIFQDFADAQKIVKAVRG